MTNDELDLEQVFRQSVPEDWPEWVVEYFLLIDLTDTPVAGNHFEEAPESVGRLFSEKSMEMFFPRANNGIQKKKSGPALLGAYVGDIERGVNSPVLCVEDGEFTHEAIKSLPANFHEMLLKDIDHKKQTVQQVSMIATKQRLEDKKEFFDEYNKALSKDPLPDPEHFAAHEKMAAMMTMCWPDTENTKNRSELQKWMVDQTEQSDVYNLQNISKFCQRHDVGPKSPRGRPKAVKKNK